MSLAGLFQFYVHMKCWDMRQVSPSIPMLIIFNDKSYNLIIVLLTWLYNWMLCFVL